MGRVLFCELLYFMCSCEQNLIPRLTDEQKGGTLVCVRLCRLPFWSLNTVSTVSLENDGTVIWRGSEEKGARVYPHPPLTRVEDSKGPQK